MIRLLVAIALGLVLGAGLTLGTRTFLATAADGTPSSATLYQYGNR